MSFQGPNWKPARGTMALERRQKRQAILTHEAREKAAVRLRDGKKCRFPGCQERTGLEVAHLEHKGRGGDKQSLRTQRQKMIHLCLFHHRGAESLDSKDLQIRPLDAATGTDGLCAFSRRKGNTDQFLLVGLG